jgi:hypothetical protein
VDLKLQAIEMFDDQVNHHLEALLTAAHGRPPLASDAEVIGTSAQITK